MLVIFAYCIYVHCWISENEYATYIKKKISSATIFLIFISENPWRWTQVIQYCRSCSEAKVVALSISTVKFTFVRKIYWNDKLWKDKTLKRSSISILTNSVVHGPKIFGSKLWAGLVGLVYLFESIWLFSKGIMQKDIVWKHEKISYPLLFLFECFAISYLHIISRIFAHFKKFLWCFLFAKF